jgi:8-oxo-dGTP diphosphatase
MAGQPAQVAIAVVENRGRFLVGTRRDDQALAGFSEFPGGRVEAGETPQVAAVRECLEETGLVVRATAAFPPVSYDYSHGQVCLHFIACELAGSPDEPRAPFRWLGRSELAECVFPPANAPILRCLLQAS